MERGLGDLLRDLVCVLDLLWETSGKPESGLWSLLAEILNQALAVLQGGRRPRGSDAAPADGVPRPSGPLALSVSGASGAFVSGAPSASAAEATGVD